MLSRYLDGILIRTFAQADVEVLAEHASVPVINGLTDDEHPCQTLADLQTIRERLGRLAGVRLVYLGDGNNVCVSLMHGAPGSACASSPPALPTTRRRTSRSRRRGTPRPRRAARS